MAETAPATTPAPPRPELRTTDVLIIAGGTLLLMTAAFGVFARMYFGNKLLGVFSGDPMAEALIPELAWDNVLAIYFWSFAAFSVVGTAAVTGAVLYPREVGHGLAAAFGVALVIAAGKILFLSPMPAMVGFLLLTIGALMLALAWTSWHKQDRAAWAFLLALSGTLTSVLFFGTPRIRATLAVERQFYVLILPALMAAITVACVRLRRDYL